MDRQISQSNEVVTRTGLCRPDQAKRRSGIVQFRCDRDEPVLRTSHRRSGAAPLHVRAFSLLFLSLLPMLIQTTQADDWPTYRADAARSGFTRETLPEQLAIHWTHRSAHLPQPAWPRSDRMTFDRSPQIVVAQGRLFFGSTVDCQIRALDAATGKLLWSFFTDAPVRFAPAVWTGRVFAVSDDGYLYCLTASDGTLLWKRRGGPRDQLILANGRMASRWPARGGPVVVGGVVYFAAGVWPSDGLFLHAIDADSGESLWSNDSAGSLEMDQPHGGARARSGVASQGYLFASGKQLFVPTGRAVPAAFSLTDGKFQYFQLRKNGHTGGDLSMATGSQFYNSGRLFDSATGLANADLDEGPVAVWSDGLVQATEKELVVYRWIEKERRDRRGGVSHIQSPERLWTVASISGAGALVVAGGTIVCGAKNRVVTVDLESRKVGWSMGVDGDVFSLAIADGRLYVGTDRGHIHCFAADQRANPGIVQTQTNPSPYGGQGEIAKAADEILSKSGVTEGFCLDFGCGDGALACELAKRSQLQIYAIDDDRKAVEHARRKLVSAGLYGTRVTVLHADLNNVAYPDSFADLVVSGRSLTSDLTDSHTIELTRMQRPFGGVACFGKPGQMITTVRGALVGAGSWTHQYANAANTSCSTDTRVKGPLEMLWFRDVDFELPDRHTRGPAPLFHQGKLVVLGLNAMRAVDAYNGRKLWEFPLKGILAPHNQEEHNLGVSGTGGVFCLSDDSVYVRWKGRCLRIDLQTGKLRREFKVPDRPDGKPGTWGFLAYADGTLFGSVANESHLVQNPRWQWVEGSGITWNTDSMLTESVSLFALDPDSGKAKWIYTAADSIRHNAMAIGGGSVFLIDRPLAIMDEKKRRRRGLPVHPHPDGQLVALDAASGKRLWKVDEQIYGTMLALSVKHDAILMSYQSTTDRLPSEQGGRMAVFKASDGTRLWDKPANYVTRPLINDATIYAQGGKFDFRRFGEKTGWVSAPDDGGAWDLLTGEATPLTLGRSYGCGQITGCPNLLLYRSATLGYCDLTRKQGTENYGGLRLGCWINAIPAGGLVLVSDATEGCTCSYLNRSWFALQPKR